MHAAEELEPPIGVAPPDARSEGRVQTSGPSSSHPAVGQDSEVATLDDERRGLPAHSSITVDFIISTIARRDLLGSQQQRKSPILAAQSSLLAAVVVPASLSSLLPPGPGSSSKIRRHPPVA